MASTNQSPFYKKAEADFHNATNDEDRIACLEVMIKECPKHKSSENMLRNLTLRLKKLRSTVEKQKRSGKSSREGIKKAEMQCVLAGFPNSGKSTLFQTLTNQETKISPYEFTTTQPALGTFPFEGAKVQIIDQPSFPNHDKSLTNSTDTVLLVITSLNQITESEKFLNKSRAKKLIIFNELDTSTDFEKRKIEATLNSKFKGIEYVSMSTKSPSKIEIENLKKKIFQTFPIIRVYTKEPKKEPSIDPMIMSPDSTPRDCAEKILKGMSAKIVRVKIWGPSSKFGGQVVGLDHILKDKDVIEFQTK